MEKKENFKRAKVLIAEIQEKWSEITNTGYLCYESDIELANEIIYKLFNGDVFNDIETYCRTTNKNDSGYVFKILAKVEHSIYFQFDIITRYGIDMPQKIRNGKFRLLRNIPNGWKDIVILYDEINEYEE